MNKLKEIWICLNEETKTVVKTSVVVISLILTFVVGINLGCINMIDKSEYDKVIKQYSEVKDKLNENATKLEDKKKELEEAESKYKELQKATEGYTSLNENEKQVVDSKIEEVKKQTQEQIEAEKKAEEERKAQEEAQKKAEEEKKKQEEQAKKEAEEQAKREAEAHKYETGLTWEQIAREGKVGTLGQFEGKIIQVMNGDGFTQYRVAINGDYNTIMLVEVVNSKLTETLLEDDYVYFKGESLGTYTYTTVMGAKNTIPAFEVDEIIR